MNLADPATCEELLQIAADDLMPDLMQPRKTFLDAEIDRLADSIRVRGILQPLRVQRNDKINKWIIIIGESRYHAGKKVGITHFPCLSMQGDPDEIELLIDQITENEVRSSLRPIEHARGLARVKAARKWTGTQMAEHMGLGSGSISKTLKLLTLPLAIQDMIDQGHISAFAGYEIARLPDEASMLTLAEAVAKGQVVGNAVSDAVQAVVGKKKVKPSRERISLPLEGGCLSLSSDQPITWDVFNAMLERIRRVARVFHADHGDIADLAGQFRK